MEERDVDEGSKVKQLETEEEVEVEDVGGNEISEDQEDEDKGVGTVE